MSTELYAKLIADLGNAVGIPSLVPDEEGYCILGLDERIVLVMQYEPETESIVLFTDLGPCPSNDKSEFLADLLKANCLWAGTGGATLGLNADTGTILLCYRMPARHFEFEPFQSTIEGMVNTAEFWKSRMESHGRGETPSAFQDAGPMNLKV